ncbi:hypothetical protein ACQEUX_03585 [Micromonospora sp. CA-259024]|uniref:hypothetical protein n=1 Tax=Micromonospora sp. CA-259024 TaxID=3239965 RepID=UPI003D89F7B7
MVIWVNGALGDGKHALIDALSRPFPEHIFFDPERVGFIPRDLVWQPEIGDVQDLPAPSAERAPNVDQLRTVWWTTFHQW